MNQQDLRQIEERVDNTTHDNTFIAKKKKNLSKTSLYYQAHVLCQSGADSHLLVEK